MKSLKKIGLSLFLVLSLGFVFSMPLSAQSIPVEQMTTEQKLTELNSISTRLQEINNELWSHSKSKSQSLNEASDSQMRLQSELTTVSERVEQLESSLKTSQTWSVAIETSLSKVRYLLIEANESLARYRALNKELQDELEVEVKRKKVWRITALVGISLLTIINIGEELID